MSSALNFKRAEVYQTDEPFDDAPIHEKSKLTPLRIAFLISMIIFLVIAFASLILRRKRYYRAQREQENARRYHRTRRERYECSLITQDIRDAHIHRNCATQMTQVSSMEALPLYVPSAPMPCRPPPAYNNTPPVNKRYSV